MLEKSVSQFLNELWGTFFVDKSPKEVASGRLWVGMELVGEDFVGGNVNCEGSFCMELVEIL